MAKGGYQRRRIQQMKEQQRRKRRRAQRQRKVLQWTVGTVVFALIAGMSALAFVARNNDETSAKSTPTPSESGACTKAGPDTVGKKKFANPPCQFIDRDKKYTATLKTSVGTIKVRLFPVEAPKTVNNFVFLAQQKFYDGSIFHRVIPNFMIQGGDAAARNGSGDAGYKFDDENTEPFDKPGYLAMANSGPGTNGSQFFITQVKIDHLNKKGTCPGPQGCHSVFGEVTSGQDVVNKIVAVQRDAQDKPKKDVVLVSVTIEVT